MIGKKSKLMVRIFGFNKSASHFGKINPMMKNGKRQRSAARSTLDLKRHVASEDAQADTQQDRLLFGHFLKDQQGELPKEHAKQTKVPIADSTVDF